MTSCEEHHLDLMMMMMMMMIDGPDDGDLGGHSPPSLCLVSSVHGIAIATGNSSLCRVSTVTDLLSFISVARATQPRLIDGISALPQQRGWEVGLLAIDFQPL